MRTISFDACACGAKTTPETTPEVSTEKAKEREKRIAIFFTA
jgi:hypothetical protein